MMYESKLVACLKANGKVLREHKDIVYVPFGTEYSVQIKNLNSKRALVKVEIDGTDVSSGSRLVVDPNETFDLTRFIRNGNLSEGNRFKFIELTAGVEKHRGIGMEDGIIRIEFQFERSAPVYRPIYDPFKLNMLVKYGDDLQWGSRYSPNSHYVGTCSTQAYHNDTPGNLRSPAALYGASVANASVANASVTNASVSDAGITVPGSKSDQRFATIKDFAVDAEKFVMVLKLLGETEMGKLVVEPITVKSKPTCVTCGRVNKAGASYCSNCGTALDVV